MKRLCVMFAVLGLLSAACSALALNEEDYREFLKDSEFAAADAELKQALGDAKSALSKDAYDKLRASQREWVKSERDDDAEELIDLHGYSRIMAYISVTRDRARAIREMSGTDKKIATGIVKADKDYVTVIAEGVGKDKQDALEQAYIEAVRLAVGMILSAKTELNNNELSESIIAHSRGVIEGFDILDTKNEGGETKLYIQARVHKEILQDETKKYVEAQTVKADTGGVVKEQMDEHAKASTTQAKQKSGGALLNEVLDKVGPEDFFSAALNPKIQYDKKTKKPYLQITEKFNQTYFWDEFLPKLRSALDGVAVKKTKEFYADNVRKANQRFPKEGYLVNGGIGNNNDKPYRYTLKNENRSSYSIIIPDNVATFMVYEMPFRSLRNSFSLRSFYEKDITVADDISEENAQILLAILHFMQRMCRPVTYSITYLDKDSDVISVQVIRTGTRALAIYRSVDRSGIIRHILAFAPGYVSGKDWRNLFLGTTNYNQKFGGGYEVEIDSDELQRLDSMKFEVIFE